MRHGLACVTGLLALGWLAGCASSDALTLGDQDGAVNDDGAVGTWRDSATSDHAVDAERPDGSAPGKDGSTSSTDAGCPGVAIELSALGGHNTSASPTYDKTHFAANFGSTSWISQSGTTTPVDPAKMDMSMNPVTPGHVSGVDVHTLIPSRPDLRWFAHVTPWFRSGGGGGHIDIGLQNDSAAYVAAMVTDMKNRGFDGLIVDWYGKGSYEDAVTLLIQQYLATLSPGSFKFILMMDKGIAGLSQSVLQQQLSYVRTQYLADPNYELEGGHPIVMFFGVDAVLGSTGMAGAKAAEGGGQIWVTQGAASLSNAWVDQCFDWAHDFHTGPSPTDPYNLASVASFYSSVGATTKGAFGSMVAGFNGTLTKSVGWSEGKYLPRGSGACLVQWAQKIDTVVPKNVTRMQWVTWSDWEEGTQVESGVENDAAVTSSVSGSTLSWNVTAGTGDESTIDHFEVYASSNGVTAVEIATVPAGSHSLDLSKNSCLLSGVSYGLEVVAVGKPMIRNHVSAPAKFTP